MCSVPHKYFHVTLERAFVAWEVESVLGYNLQIAHLNLQNTAINTEVYIIFLQYLQTSLKFNGQSWFGVNNGSSSFLYPWWEQLLKNCRFIKFNPDEHQPLWTCDQVGFTMQIHDLTASITILVLFSNGIPARCKYSCVLAYHEQLFAI